MPLGTGGEKGLAAWEGNILQKKSHGASGAVESVTDNKCVFNKAQASDRSKSEWWQYVCSYQCGISFNSYSFNKHRKSTDQISIWDCMAIQSQAHIDRRKEGRSCTVCAVPNLHTTMVSIRNRFCPTLSLTSSSPAAQMGIASGLFKKNAWSVYQGSK